MVKIISFDPTPRGYNPCAVFYFANTAFYPGDNNLIDVVFDGITAHPDWDDYINDGTFTTSEIVTNLIPFFSSPYTGVLDSVYDASQIAANTLAIQQLQLQAHDPVTPTDASLIENTIVEQEFAVQLDTITPNNILQITAAGLYATGKMSWAWYAGRDALLSTPMALRGVDGIVTSRHPYVAFRECSIRQVIVVNDPDQTTDTWEGIIEVNGVQVYSLIRASGVSYLVSPDLNIALNQGDNVVMYFRNNSAAIDNPGIHVLVSEN